MTQPKKPATNPKALSLARTPGQTEAQALSRAALRPSINCASVIEAYQVNLMGKDVDLSELAAGLNDTFKRVEDGDLSTLEAMLVAQATALQTMFASLARRAATQEHLRQYETFMGLALKAQAQSRATITALVDLKYPRQATFVKQANIAHGPQQVNNGAAAGADPAQDAQAGTHAENSHPSKTNYWRQSMGNPAKGWTPERRKRQSEAIKRWNPWNKSTGPKSPAGKTAVANNAWTGGHWRKLRQTIKDLNQALRVRRDRLGR